MQLTPRLLPVLTLALFATFTSCKKEATTQTDSDNMVEVQTHTDDQSRVSTDMDDVADDANVALETNTSFTGRFMDAQNTNGIICGATSVTDTAANPRTITITYNGNNCANTELRTGVVTLSMPAGTKWKNAGAAITVTYQNLKIKRLSDAKSITINGSHTLTNVTGGLLAQLPTLQNIIHTIASSNMSITFDDNSQRTWSVGRKRTFTYNNGVVLSISGIGVSGTASNLAEWGSNRYGHAFTTAIREPLVFRQSCDFRLTSGKIEHQGFASASITFGLDASGAPAACPGTGHYYYNLTWTGPLGGSHTVILPY